MVVQDEINIQVSSINQKSNNATSVMLFTGATFVKKEPLPRYKYRNEIENRRAYYCNFLFWFFFFFFFFFEMGFSLEPLCHAKHHAWQNGYGRRPLIIIREQPKNNPPFQEILIIFPLVHFI